MNYYNENDKYSADWLENLIAGGVIPPGNVDRRDIRDVRPGDLDGYTQCHFFAGIGGWAHALDIATVTPDSRLWTGSCPCQPFSTAGRGQGDRDTRHLWPALRWLIKQCRPPVVFGEQVASPAGRQWLAGVQADVEALDYTTGGADLCAAGVGAPHMRQRLYWVAESRSQRQSRTGLHVWQREARERMSQAAGRRKNDGVADATSERLDGLEDTAGPTGGHGTQDSREASGLGDTNCVPAGWYTRSISRTEETGESERQDAWSLAHCTSVTGADDKVRRIESTIKPLVDGLPGRVGQLRAYGNAIVPQVAAEFIGAYLDTQE
jgi:DNA (cytosine-5)-methyltransferase 1